ncbi:MAG: hypothetical protein JRG91_19210 [Deltaproteobacteria bacterium]|nr:hypothetical protein [Deltaproteobacteria bacterium]
MCSASTSFEEGTVYTAGEFKDIVAMGFPPPESTITTLSLQGVSRSEAAEAWKSGLVATTTTDWLLCPNCASKASTYVSKSAGSGLISSQRTESLSPIVKGIMDSMNKPTGGSSYSSFSDSSSNTTSSSGSESCVGCGRSIEGWDFVCPHCGKFQAAWFFGTMIGGIILLGIAIHVGPGIENGFWRFVVKWGLGFVGVIISGMFVYGLVTAISRWTSLKGKVGDSEPVQAPSWEEEKPEPASSETPTARDDGLPAKGDELAYASVFTLEWILDLMKQADSDQLDEIEDCVEGMQGWVPKFMWKAEVTDEDRELFELIQLGLRDMEAKQSGNAEEAAKSAAKVDTWAPFEDMKVKIKKMDGRIEPVLRRHGSPDKLKSSFDAVLSGLRGFFGEPKEEEPVSKSSIGQVLNTPGSDRLDKLSAALEKLEDAGGDATEEELQELAAAMKGMETLPQEIQEHTEKAKPVTSRMAEASAALMKGDVKKAEALTDSARAAADRIVAKDASDRADVLKKLCLCQPTELQLALGAKKAGNPVPGIHHVGLSDESLDEKQTQAVLEKATVKEIQKVVDMFELSQAGDGLAQSGNHKEAIGKYEKAVEVAPYDPITMMSLGVCYAETGSGRKSVEILEKAVKLDPGNERIKGNLSAIKQAFGF